MADALYLTRRDPARNMARFYQIEIAPDLFGGVVLIRDWGRIGNRGQQLRQWWPDAAQAETSRQAWLAQKSKRGYLADSD